MAVKAILFDSSRCSACQACVAACKGRFGLGPASSSEDMAARAFGRAFFTYSPPTTGTSTSSLPFSPSPMMIWQPVVMGLKPLSMALSM